MVMPAVRPRSNGEPLTEAPRTPVVALIGKTLTLVPAPLPSTAIRNLGVVGNAPTDGDRLSAEHETRTNASSTLAGALNGILVFILFSSKYAPAAIARSRQNLSVGSSTGRKSATARSVQHAYGVGSTHEGRWDGITESSVSTRNSRPVFPKRGKTTTGYPGLIYVLDSYKPLLRRNSLTTSFTSRFWPSTA